MQRLVFPLVVLALAGCGDSAEPPTTYAKELEAARRELARTGQWCCYESGEPTTQACSISAEGCAFSEVEDDVDRRGRGSVCGYLSCPAR